MIKRSIKDLFKEGHSHPLFDAPFCHSLSDTFMITRRDDARRSEKIDPSEIFMFCAVCTAHGCSPEANRVFFSL